MIDQTVATKLSLKLIKSAGITVDQGYKKCCYLSHMPSSCHKCIQQIQLLPPLLVLLPAILGSFFPYYNYYDKMLPVWL